jgi:hypothetical protein
VVKVATLSIHPFVGLLGGLLILIEYFLTGALSALSGVIYLTVVDGPRKPLLVVTVAAVLSVLVSSTSRSSRTDAPTYVGRASLGADDLRRPVLSSSLVGAGGSSS